MCIMSPKNRYSWQSVTIVTCQFPVAMLSRLVQWTGVSARIYASAMGKGCSFMCMAMLPTIFPRWSGAWYGWCCWERCQLGPGGYSLVERCRRAFTFRVNIAAIPLRCQDLSMPVPEKARAVFVLVLQGLDLLQTAERDSGQIAALEAKKIESSANFHLVEDHARLLTKNNRRLLHGVIVLNVNKECREAQ